MKNLNQGLIFLTINRSFLEGRYLSKLKSILYQTSNSISVFRRLINFDIQLCSIFCICKTKRDEFFSSPILRIKYLILNFFFNLEVFKDIKTDPYFCKCIYFYRHCRFFFFLNMKFPLKQACLFSI